MLAEDVLFGTLLGVAATLAPALLSRERCRPLATAVSAATAAAMLALLYPYGGAAGVIGLTAYLVALAALLSAPGYIPREDNLAFHDALILVLAATSYLVAVTESLVRLFVLWEAMGVAVAVVTAYEKKRESVEAALKYVMMCGAGGLLAAAGIALTGLEAGSLTLGALARASLAARALVAVGFAVEAAVFPLYLWLPDAHMTAPSTGSSILSGIVIESAVYVVYRVSASSPRLLWLLAAAALIGAFAGNLAAYRQDDLKRLLAYSSVANANYIMLGLTVGGAAASYAVLHILAHGLLKAAFFLLAGALAVSYGTRSLESLRGALAGTWAGKLVAVAAAMGLTGVPPFLTFWSEAFMAAGIYVRSPLLAAAFAAAVLVSFGYYFHVFYTLCRGSGEAGAPARGWPMIYAALALVLLDVALGVAWALGVLQAPVP